MFSVWQLTRNEWLWVADYATRADARGHADELHRRGVRAAITLNGNAPPKKDMQ
jgi:hypothetical protein